MGASYFALKRLAERVLERRRPSAWGPASQQRHRLGGSCGVMRHASERQCAKRGLILNGNGWLGGVSFDNVQGRPRAPDRITIVENARR